jgi:hypothetical protein
VLQGNIYLPETREGEKHVPPSPVPLLVDVDKELAEVPDLTEADDPMSHRFMSVAYYDDVALRDSSGNEQIINALKRCVASTVAEHNLDEQELAECIRTQQGGPHPDVYITKWSVEQQPRRWTQPLQSRCPHSLF